jgi:peptide deformylase
MRERSRGIVSIGDPMLREAAQEVLDDQASDETLAYMVGLLRELSGAGLAAPQIGVPLALAVIEVRRTALFPDRPESGLMKLINPEIVPLTETVEMDWEKCFSIPDLMGLVPRYSLIQVSYLGSSGSRVHQQCSGYLARVVQHEVDHLEGRLFVDRMSSMTSLTTVENYLQYHTPSSIA